jgi:hypothetical protein
MRYISDIQLLDFIGLRTYLMLWNYSPDLYLEIPECDNYSESLKKSDVASNVTDFKALFIDSNYTPKKLKQDLKMIYIKLKPTNTFAYRFVKSSPVPHGISMDGLSWFIFIIIIVMFWVSIIINFYYIVRYTNFKSIWGDLR